MRKLLALIVLLCAAVDACADEIHPISTFQDRGFVLVYSITVGGNTIAGQTTQNFATIEECTAARIQFIEAWRATHPQVRPSDFVNAICQPVKR